MQFNDSQAIYLQIADWVCERIITGEWKPDEKILSVRELAIELEVNPNTVMRTYEQLQQTETIYNKRGIGFFVGREGKSKAIQNKRQHYLNTELPLLFKTMSLLDISIDEIERLYKEYKSK